MTATHHQVIFLTDDYRATEKYVNPVLGMFPSVSVWNSYDFVVYFVYKISNRIPVDIAIAALRDINPNVIKLGAMNPSLTPEDQATSSPSRR